MVGIHPQECLQARRARRGKVLGTSQALTGRRCGSSPRHWEQGRSYGPEVYDAISIIAEPHRHICAERLQPAVVGRAEHLARHREFALTDVLCARLASGLLAERPSLAARALPMAHRRKAV